MTYKTGKKDICTGFNKSKNHVILYRGLSVYDDVIRNIEEFQDLSMFVEDFCCHNLNIRILR